MTIQTRKLDRDKLSMVPREQAADAAHLALHGIQDESPEVLTLGVAVLFHAVVTKANLDPETLFKMGGKVLRDADYSIKTNNSLQSLRDFASIRVLGRETTIS